MTCHLCNGSGECYNWPPFGPVEIMQCRACAPRRPTPATLDPDELTDEDLTCAASLFFGRAALTIGRRNNFERDDYGQ